MEKAKYTKQLAKFVIAFTGTFFVKRAASEDNEQRNGVSMKATASRTTIKDYKLENNVDQTSREYFEIVKSSECSLQKLAKLDKKIAFARDLGFARTAVANSTSTTA